MTRVVAPGAALGVLGGSQLGRMFAIAARRMGYRVHTFSPEGDSPASQAADLEVTASYADLDAVEALAPVRPSGVALHTAQERAREKTFLADRGIPTAPFAPAATLDELWEAVARVGTPAAIVPAAATQAAEITRTILEELHYVGVLCVEFFLSTDGELLVNELAPRPHNSGHRRSRARLRWQTFSAISGSTASPTGPQHAGSPTSYCICTARPIRGRGARWGTSPRSGEPCRTRRIA